MTLVDNLDECLFNYETVLKTLLMTMSTWGLYSGETRIPDLVFTSSINLLLICSLETLFAQLDSTHQGYVTIDDAFMVLSQKFSGLNESSMRAMISNYDYDNNNRIDYKEFIGFFNRIRNKYVDEMEI